MIKERLYFASQHFVASHLLLIVLFLLIRSMEYVIGSFAHPLPEDASMLILTGYVFDIWFVLLLGTIMYPVYLSLYLLIGSVTRYFLFLVFVMYTVIYITLIQYYTITMIPLSADFWGYSADDIKTTVSASAELSFGTFIPFIVTLGVLFYSYMKIQEVIMPQWFVWTYGSISLAASIVYVAKTPEPGWFTSDKIFTFNVNKMAYFSEKSLVYYFEKTTASDHAADAEYPLVRDADTADMLGPYFNPLPPKPNIVVLMVEGLGGTFVGPRARYGGCTPFLDSLARHSLYWQYMLSTTGRTFGILPGLMGSLPYGEKGFMETGAGMPSHLTLFRLLKLQGYQTRYFYGGNINFDMQDVFLERQKVDYVLSDEKFPPRYKKLEANSEGFSWGYSDGDLFKYSLELFPADTTTPHLSVYMTINTHEPFKVPDQQKYLQQLAIIAARQAPAKKQSYTQYQSELSSLLYTDNAIREFINAYKQRNDYQNTIFVITGDHRMIPIEQVNRIDRYHVPFIIFSPLLKRTALFSAVSTHHDFAPTLLATLQKNTPMHFPQKVHWMGHLMDTTREFNCEKDQPLMRNKNELVDYIDHQYFLSDNILYEITSDLDLNRIDDSDKLNEIKEKLTGFKRVSQYMFAHNKIYNDSLIGAVKPEFEFTRKEQFMLQYVHADTLGRDSLFELARRYIYAGNDYMGRLICMKVLLRSPNYTEVRVLLGRSYAWAREYDEARKQLQDAVRRSPDYHDAYVALIDMETWSDNYDRAISLADTAYKTFKDKLFYEKSERAKRFKAEYKADGKYKAAK